VGEERICDGYLRCCMLGLRDSGIEDRNDSWATM
jgi:hypothetical protein